MREGAAKGAARARAKLVPVMRVRLSPACPHCASPWTGESRHWKTGRHTCASLKGESLKKEVSTLRAAWKEDEKARREEHEADKTKPLRNHVLGRRFPLGGCESSLRASTKRGGGTDESGGTASHLVPCQSGYSLSRCSVIFRARPRHPEPKADRAWVWAFLMQESVKSEIHLAMKSICAFHNATLFFAPQRSQDGQVVQWLRDMRKGNKAQGAGGDDIDEDMGTDNTKRPRRR